MGKIKINKKIKKNYFIIKKYYQLTILNIVLFAKYKR